MADVVRVVLTYQDYAALPSDGRRYELHEGELSVTPKPGTRHQWIVGELFALLREHVNARGLGKVFVSPVDCILSDTTVVEPDVVYLDPTRAGLVSDRAIEGAPMLAVEVLSPSTARTDRSTKLQLYAKHRVPFYWIVEPDGPWIEAYVLTGDAFRLAAHLGDGESGTLPPFQDLTPSLAQLLS